MLLFVIVLLEKKMYELNTQFIDGDHFLNRCAFVTHEDICHCFKGDTLLAVQAPSGTQLEVPIPEVVSDRIVW